MRTDDEAAIVPAMDLSALDGITDPQALRALLADAQAIIVAIIRASYQPLAHSASASA